MSMFINGLKYIIPCQSRFSQKPIDDIITEQYKNVSTIVKDCLQDNRISTTDQLANQAFQALELIFQEYQSKNVSKKLKIRAQHIVIRRTDKSKVFYIGKAADFERKAEEYMLKTEAYEEIKNGRCPLADNLHAVQTLFDYLPETPLRPIVASLHAPATLASKFLNDILAPIYLKKKYATDGYLTSKTKFITIDVENLYTMIPRDGALTAFARFCVKYYYQGKIGTFTIDHIMKMARLILATNGFAYNNKYYKQIRGGAMGSAYNLVICVDISMIFS
ncbi:unnamed protein product [Adineta steineri]|uniref:Reverse transcriptase domain-containing protein n=1 Tax=Adineta steineri TaxID=433720 RepID=A0A815JFQ8_9BILA|nr:unnamed protein product [Adineta steineri]